ncbi:MAG: PfkB family carbohydrate kinase [Euryarchaeota archaeon]|nr:PfkB family carbohydrate kinase [Euryarchaeota archaeon]
MYFDLAVIGNLTLDHIVTPFTEINTFGGTAAYTSITARRLGSSVGIVSKIGSDFPQTYLNQLRKEDVDLYCVEVSNATTQFELVYDHNWNRRLKLKAQCAKILPEDIPKKFFDTKIIHFGPVFQEIDYRIVSFVKDNFTGEISLSLQGLVRVVKNDTIEISHPSDLDRILEAVDILFANETEIIFDPSKELNQNIEIFKKLGPKIIIITLGKKGSIIFSGDDSFHYSTS